MTHIYLKVPQIVDLRKQITNHRLRKSKFSSLKISFGCISNSRNVLFLHVCSVLMHENKKKKNKLLRNLLCNLLRNPLNLTWPCTKDSQNLLRNPVEPDLALHQSLPDLLRNLRNLLRLRCWGIKYQATSCSLHILGLPQVTTPAAASGSTSHTWTWLKFKCWDMLGCQGCQWRCQRRL